VTHGSFSIVIDLENSKEYEFKYLLDENVWLNDDSADNQVTTPFGDSSNSVVSV